MSTDAVLLVCMGVVLFTLLALEGERRFAGRARIPIHWGFDMRPNGAAPRRIGLAIFPVLGSTVLLVLGLHGAPVFILAAALLSLATLNCLYFRAVARAPATP
ncbi:hypothetical protein [Acidocella sp.]|uniref:hypothetical protein n=1 Tax=Acidocella sp. TaxID=50710 RepID=UPI00261EB87D|nr:hypothetical protein [Acidocella sp.]